jgi:hypothetical protein
VNQPTLQDPELDATTPTQIDRDAQATQLPVAESAERYAARNFLVLALYQILLRTGWIFKAESIVMPAVLDTLTGGGPLGGFLRGFLPILNRIGHSVPPVLASGHLKRMRRKNRALLASTTSMSAVFALLASLWWFDVAGESLGLTVVFLVLYLAFFAATGINNVTLSTLQGKLVKVHHRGRLLLTANVLGAATAIGSVLWLMPGWLTPDGPQFGAMFGFTAACFAAAALSQLLLHEPPDYHAEHGRGVRHLFGSAWALIRHDRSFRRLAIVGMAFSSSLILFPHYQSLARSSRMNLSFDSLLIWVIVQNAGTALFSLLVGPLADRRGNRLVMHLIMFGIAAMPSVAIALAHAGRWGALAYPVIFFMLGLTPIGFKIFNNYTLEICPPENHTKYLSTLALCYAVPLIFAPLFGWLVEVTSYELVFGGVSLIVFAGWLGTFTLEEPRRRVAEAEAQAGSSV